MEIKEIIESITAKLSGIKKHDEQIYRDEPILQVASKMRSYLPEQYRKLRQMYKYEGHSSAGFYKQAKFMENYEDDYDYNGHFFCYYPTYCDMNNEQLRGYFSWRTKVRRGNIQKTSLSFVFIYLYELINLIGVDTPEQGYLTLKNFWETYQKFDSSLNKYVRMWLGDFTVYYQLPTSFHPDADAPSAAKHYITLRDYKAQNDNEIFTALTAVSTYNIENSRFYKQHPDDVKTVAAAVYRAMSDYFEKHRKNTYCEKLMGKMFEFDYRIFQSAYFYDTRNYKDYEYTVNDIKKYRCKNGKWSTIFLWSANGTKSPEMGVTMRAIDRILRQKTGFSYALKDDGKTTKLLTEFIEKAVDALLDEKEKARQAANRITINTSLLSDIRRSAEKTRNKLIVEEGEAKDEPPVLAEKAVEKTEDTLFVKEKTETSEHPILAEKTTATENEWGLDSCEYEFLRLFLYGGDYKALLAKTNSMLSVVTDSVNDKLFDTFGDTVIDFSADEPTLVEDYEEELKGLIKP